MIPPPPTAYGIIALDLDGTLLDGGGKISAANRAAIAAAQAAGVLVVPNTGRSWRESRKVLRQFPVPDDGQVGVFVTGAAISDVATGKTVDSAVIEPQLAMQIVTHLADLPEAVLVFRDAELAGHDYLVTGRGMLSANTQWWFQSTAATVRFQSRVKLVDLQHTLRVGIVADGEQASAVARWLSETMGDSVLVQSFEAVQPTQQSPSVHVLEVFARGVDKWRGLDWIARRHGVEPARIAVIGDGVNDLAAIRLAGCGIAMGNADDDVKTAADRITSDCHNDGVAHAIEQLLTGRW